MIGLVVEDVVGDPLANSNSDIVAVRKLNHSADEDECKDESAEKNRRQRPLLLRK